MTTISWQHRLQEVARDRERGASELIVDALDCLLDAFDKPADFHADPVRSAMIALRFNQPAMAPVLNLTAEVCHWLDNPYPEHDRTAWVNRMRKNVLDMRDLQTTADQMLRERMIKLDLPGERFGFFSWSSTVANGFRAMAKRLEPARAFVGESLPGGEGKKMAEFLARLGWSVWLVSDMQLTDYARSGKLDTLILGCDAYDNTHFVNKIGSGALAALMSRMGKRVEIWAGPGKRVNPMELRELDMGEAEPPPSVATGIATPRPLFGVGLLDDVDVLRTPSEDHTRQTLMNGGGLARSAPIAGYLKLENRPA